MKTRAFILIVAACAVLLLAASLAAAEDGEFYFWRWGHMEGPHDSSKALGISRDGMTAVGATTVVDFTRAWRSDIEWAIHTDDELPPLYNELQVQEDIGIIAPSRPSAAYAASDMTSTPCPYDLPALQLDWCESTVVGTYTLGTVSYSLQWLLPVLDSVDDGDYVAIPDFGGGASLMEALDVSADGLIMVGYGNNRRGPLAFRADMTDPLLPVVKTLTITDSVYTDQTLKWTVAEAILVDPATGEEWIAGYGGTKRGNRAFVTQVLDASTDPITLASVVLPKLGGGKWNEAYAMVMTDEVGPVVAGRSDSAKGPQACIWWLDGTTGEWVVKGLGGLSKKSLDSVATGIVHRHGSTAGELLVVGRSESILYPSEAMIWAGNAVLEDDDVGYMYDLEYILIKTGAADRSACGSEWILNSATAVSFDPDLTETRMVGWGTNPEGGIEAYVITGFPYDMPELTYE